MRGPGSGLSEMERCRLCLPWPMKKKRSRNFWDANAGVPERGVDGLKNDEFRRKAFLDSEGE